MGERVGSGLGLWNGNNAEGGGFVVSEGADEAESSSGPAGQDASLARTDRRPAASCNADGAAAAPLEAAGDATGADGTANNCCN